MADTNDLLNSSRRGTCSLDDSDGVKCSNASEIAGVLVVDYTCIRRFGVLHCNMHTLIMKPTISPPFIDGT